MKKFLCTLAIFLVIPLVTIALLDMRLRTMNNSYRDKVEGLAACSDSVEILILGNSREAYGVDPACFEHYAYNLASVNQSLYFDKRLTLKYLDELTNLKAVLIPLDYHSLYCSSQGNRDVWSFYGHGIAYKDNRYVKERISPFLFGYTPMVSATILGRDLMRRLSHRGPQTLDFDVEQGVDITVPVYRGFIAMEGQRRGAFDDSAYKARLGEFWWTENVPGEYEEVLADLEDFISILQQRGITPILYSAPLYEEFRPYLNPLVLEKNRTAADYLTDRYGIRFLDFASCDAFTKDDFFNCDHLNRQGARKFSRMLNDAINER